MPGVGSSQLLRSQGHEDLVGVHSGHHERDQQDRRDIAQLKELRRRRDMVVGLARQDEEVHKGQHDNHFDRKED